MLRKSPRIPAPVSSASSLASDTVTVRGNIHRFENGKFPNEMRKICESRFVCSCVRDSSRSLDGHKFSFNFAPKSSTPGQSRNFLPSAFQNRLALRDTADCIEDEILS